MIRPLRASAINNHIGMLIANITNTAKYLGQALDRISILEEEVKALKACAALSGPLEIHRHGPALQGIPKPAPTKPKLRPEDDPNSPDWVPF